MVLESRGHGTAAIIKFPANTERSASNPFNVQGAKPRDNRAPLADSGGANGKRPRDIRGSLKVINNVLLQHGLPFTTVESGLQPHSKAMALTLVSMDKRLPTLADRLRDAMKESGISASDLARACNVSPAAVSKWLDGQTKELKASNYIDAARALGVREEWLRTGKLPRERDAADQEERAAERVLSLLEDLRDPLTALVKALDEISTLRKPTTKKRRA